MTLKINNFKRLLILLIFMASLAVSDISVLAAEQDDLVITGVEISTTTMMYAVKKVNIRKEPNTSSEILGELEPGDNIFAVELTDEGWYRVVYEGETGYIRGDFLAVFGDADAWLASETEPVPIEEQDIMDAEESNSDIQESDNDAIENTENVAEDSTEAAQSEEQSNKGINIYTILIIVTLVIVIFVYAVIQIVNDNKNPDEESEEDDDDDSEEDDYDYEPDEDDYDYDSETDIEIVDLDEDE